MSLTLFGTDGVRGKAGEFPLDRETVRRLGAALVRARRPRRVRGTDSARWPRYARERTLDRT